MKNKKAIIIPFSIAAVSALLHLIFTLSTDFSDKFNATIAMAFRTVLCKLNGIFPFSLAEFILYSIPIIIACIVIITKKRTKSMKHALATLVYCAICTLVGIYALFILTFASGYNCSPLNERLDIDRNKISAEELFDTLTYVTEKTNNAAKNITFNEDGSSSLPYSYNELSRNISNSYEKVYSKKELGYTFYSKVKPIAISPFMTYTHISGVYSFFTGEANINTNYPDYVCAFSAAHEMAHQRGISKEDEANFTAYLICIESDDPYLVYSGYLSMFNYLASALKTADNDLYTEATSKLCKEAKGELYAYSVFFEKYRDNTASKVSDVVNDTYLKSQGTEGVKSYGMVVDLAVAYHKTHK